MRALELVVSSAAHICGLSAMCEQTEQKQKHDGMRYQLQEDTD